MLKEKDFDMYGLESLLTDSKHKIDTTDPERETVVNSTLNALQSLKKFTVARQFEDKWMMHGLSDNLKESFAPKFEDAGIDCAMMTKPKQLKANMMSKAMNDIKSFGETINNSEYLTKLNRRLHKVEKDVMKIFLDEQTTYEHVDVVAFAKTKIHGYNYENFTNKLKGIQILLGAFNTFPREKYESESIKQSMNWHLLQAGFSFDGRLIVAPKDDEVIVNDTLENLGWTPEKVNASNSTIDSAMTLERNLNVLSDITPKAEAAEATKMTATLVENCYNVRNIMSYVKNTLYTMCNQYLTMVRSYQ